MFFIVALNTTNKDKIIVPFKWIYKLDLVKLLNYGKTAFKKMKVIVYFSKFFDDEPDFNCCRSDVFIARRAACYEATIVRSFGKFGKTEFRCTLSQ